MHLQPDVQGITSLHEGFLSAFHISCLSGPGCSKHCQHNGTIFKEFVKSSSTHKIKCVHIIC